MSLVEGKLLPDRVVETIIVGNDHVLVKHSCVEGQHLIRDNNLIIDLVFHVMQVKDAAVDDRDAL